MKDLLSKKHYSDKIHTLLLMKGGSAYSLFLWTTPTPHLTPNFYWKILIPSFYDFSKIPTYK